jgi:hypothetical protein
MYPPCLSTLIHESAFPLSLPLLLFVIVGLSLHCVFAAPVFVLVVFVLESPRSIACGICAEGSIGVMPYTTLGAKVVRLWLTRNVNALLVFFVTDLPLATRMVSRASNVACKLSCSVGAEMLSSTKTRRRLCLLLPYRKQLEYKCCSIAIAPPSRV